MVRTGLAASLLRTDSHSRFVIRCPVPTALVPTRVPTFGTSNGLDRDHAHNRDRRLPDLLDGHASAVVQVFVVAALLRDHDACTTWHSLHHGVGHALLPGHVMEGVSANGSATRPALKRATQHGAPHLRQPYGVISKSVIVAGGNISVKSEMFPACANGTAVHMILDCGGGTGGGLAVLKE